MHCRVSSLVVVVMEIWKQCDAVCFDVDSTVITGEGLDELSAFLGKGKEVAELWVLTIAIGCFSPNDRHIIRSIVMPQIMVRPIFLLIILVWWDQLRGRMDLHIICYLCASHLGKIHSSVEKSHRVLQACTQNQIILFCLPQLSHHHSLIFWHCWDDT